MTKNNVVSEIQYTITSIYNICIYAPDYLSVIPNFILSDQWTTIKLSVETVSSEKAVLLQLRKGVKMGKF